MRGVSAAAAKKCASACGDAAGAMPKGVIDGASSHPFATRLRSLPKTHRSRNRPQGRARTRAFFWQQGAERVPKRVLKGFRLPNVSVVCAYGQARRISSRTIRYGAGPPARSARCVLCDRNLSCDSCAKRTAPCFVSCICSHEAGGGCVRTGFSGRGFLSGAS